MSDQTPNLTRRSALAAAASLGVSVSFMARAADAATPGKKMVVVICRGAMDGLSVSPPVGDPNYKALRGQIALGGFGEAGGALKLDDTFGLHPAMTTTHALAQKGQARIAPAVATPDRARSHFEAQDVLESGSAVVYGTSSGWLNRAVEQLSKTRKVEALSVGPTAPLILRGKVEAASWSPGRIAEGDPRLPGILADLYAHDSLMSQALAQGLTTQGMAKSAMAEVQTAMMQGGASPSPAAPPVGQAQGREAARQLGATLASFMNQPNGPQVAAVSLDGFDTHANQGAATGQLANRLAYVDGVLDGLSTGLGPAWKDTVVVVATEFGRTARINGTGGTDHGTASTAIVLGGGLKRGGIVGDWPTLQQAKLFENRDTAPATDMRGLFKGVLQDHMGLDRRTLDTVVFPDSAGAAPVTGIV